MLLRMFRTGKRLYTVFLTAFCISGVNAQAPAVAGYLDYFDGDFAKVLVNQQQKFLHRSGLVMVDKVENNGYYRTVVAVDKDAYGAINRQGKVIAPFKYDGVRLLDEKNDRNPEQNYCLVMVKLNGKAGAVDSTGNVLCEPEYSEIEPLTPHTFKVKKNGLWGWRDMKSGKLLQQPQYEEVSKSYALDGLIEITQKGLVGLAKEDGTVLASPKYKDLRGWGAGANGYLYYTDASGKCGLMDKNGKEITPALYDEFSKGPSPEMIAVTQKGLIGVMNTSGVLKIPPQYTKAEPLGNIFVVWKGNKCGALDASGKNLIPIENDEITLVNNEGNYAYSGGVVAPPAPGNGSAAPVKEKVDYTYYAIVKKGKLMGMYAATGELLLPIEYEQVNVLPYYGKSFIAVTRNGKSGLADFSGKIVLPLQFDGFSTGYSSGITYLDNQLGDAKSNYLAVLQNEKIGLFSLSQHKLIIPARYTTIRWQNDEMLELSANESTALADKTGKIVIGSAKFGFFNAVSADRIVEKQYPGNESITILTDRAGHKLYEDKRWEFSPTMRNIILMPEALKDAPIQFSSGLLKVRAYGRDNFFIDSMGKTIQFDEYNFVGDFYNGLAVAGKEGTPGNTRYGIINLKKQEVYPVNLDDINAFKDDLVLVKKNGAKGLLRKDGSVFLPLIYENIDRLYDTSFYMVTQNGKEGVLDNNGKTVLPAEYKDISYDKGTRLFTLMKDGKTGMADVTGKIIIPVVYDNIAKNHGWTGNPFPLLVKKGEWYFYLDSEGKELPIRSKKQKGYN